MESRNNADQVVELFGFTISPGGTKQLIILTFLLFTIYFFYGFIQEYLTTTKGWSFGWFLTFWQFFVFALLSFFCKVFDPKNNTTNTNTNTSTTTNATANTNNHGHGHNQITAHSHTNTIKNVSTPAADDEEQQHDNSETEEEKISKTKLSSPPYQQYMLIGLLQLISMGFSNYALMYLNYPTQILFKTSKVIPVMLGGVLILGKRYSLLDYLGAVSIVSGLSLFTLADASLLPNFNAKGVICVCIALCGDALVGNVEEKLLTSQHILLNDVIFWSHFFGTLALLIFITSTGEIFDALAFCAEKDLLLPLAVFGLLSFLGMSVVMRLLKRFGCLVAVMVTSCRKVMTIILSFIVFSKPFHLKYVYGGLLVFGGIGLHVYTKNKVTIDAYWETVKGNRAVKDVV